MLENTLHYSFSHTIQIDSVDSLIGTYSYYLFDSRPESGCGYIQRALDIDRDNFSNIKLTPVYELVGSSVNQSFMSYRHLLHKFEVSDVPYDTVYIRIFAFKLLLSYLPSGNYSKLNIP